jgi:hypothetical protein
VLGGVLADVGNPVTYLAVPGLVTVLDRVATSKSVLADCCEQQRGGPLSFRKSDFLVAAGAGNFPLLPQILGNYFLLFEGDRLPLQTTSRD